jgi:hypothetical protein
MPAFETMKSERRPTQSISKAADAAMQKLKI